jgi:hypothetical protein
MWFFVCRSVFVIIVVLATSFPVFFQLKTEKQKESPIPVELENIIINARALEPELTVDIFLKLAVSDKIKSKTKKKQLLEEAFYL